MYLHTLFDLLYAHPTQTYIAAIIHKDFIPFDLKRAGPCNVALGLRGPAFTSNPSHLRQSGMRRKVVG